MHQTGDGMEEKRPPLVKAIVVLIVMMTALFSFAMFMHVETQKYDENVQTEGVLVSDVFKDNSGILGSTNKIHFSDKGIYLDTGFFAKYIVSTDDMDTEYPVLIYRNTEENHHRWNIVFYDKHTQDYNFYVYTLNPSGDAYTWWSMVLHKDATATLTASNTDGMYIQSPRGHLLLTDGCMAYKDEKPLSIRLNPGDPRMLWIENGEVYSDNWDGKMYPNSMSDAPIGSANYHIDKERQGVNRLCYTDYENKICDYYIGEPEVTVRASHLSEFEENLYVSLIAMVIAFGGVLMYFWWNVKEL